MAEFNLNENMYVKKSLAGKEDLTRGFSQEVQVRANSQIPITQLNASHFQGALVFDTFQELENTPTDFLGSKTCAIVKETGQIYFRYGSTWGTAQNIAFQVKKVEELKIVPPEVGICVVSDPVRGGVFSYVKDNATINNGGTIFDGWTRNYENEVNVRWFGAQGNGIDDDTTAINKALEFSNSVVLPDGKYLISKPLVMQPISHLRGSSNSILVSESDDVMLRVAVKCVVENINFRGLIELPKQIGIELQGGAGQTTTTQVRIVGCKFQSIGGKAISVLHIQPLQANEIVGCSFVGCNVALSLGVLANNVLVSQCLVFNSNVGLEHFGAPATITDSLFINNSLGMHFNAGQSEKGQTLIVNCSVLNSRAKAVKFEGVTSKGYVFDNCIIPSEIDFIESQNIILRNCNLTDASLSFTNSNNNKIMGCLVDETRFAHDVGGTPTCNFITSPLFTQGNLNTIEGGWVEAARLQNRFAISQNTITFLHFNSSTQGMPFHPNFSKYAFYSENVGLFDFTNVITPTCSPHITADIHLVFSKNDSTTRDNITIYLYKLNSVDEDITKPDSGRMYLFSHSIGWSNAFFIASFVGKVPRGLYKVCVRLGSISDLYLVENKSPFFNNGGEIRTYARFEGI